MTFHGRTPVSAMIKRVNEAFECKVNNELMELGLTSSQMKVLVVLNEQPDGTATLKDLEHFFGVAQATAAGLASRLEKKGLIESYQDSMDRRVKHLRLSEEGLRICEYTREYMDESERWLTASLDEEEEAQFYRLLRKIYIDMQRSGNADDIWDA